MNYSKSNKKKMLLFLFFGGINFIIAYALFVLFWTLLAKFIGYFGVLVINIITSTFISYAVQTRWVWKGSRITLRNYLKYVGYQFAIVPFAIYLVPRLSESLQVSLLLIQLIYSIITAVLTWYFLKFFIYRNKF